MADPFPLYLPAEARRLFQTESLLRRMAQTAQWSADSRLLELHGSMGGLALSKALGCSVTVVEPEARILDQLRERARVAEMSGKTAFLGQPTTTCTFPAESFDGIFCLGRVVGAPTELAKKCRVWLAPKGRLAITMLLKVSRAPSSDMLSYWEKRLGAPLPSALGALKGVEAQGFEPELLESMGDAELDDYYREFEPLLAKLPADHVGAQLLREEAKLHRAQNGRAGVTWAVLVARRAEPGEQPPESRDGG